MRNKEIKKSNENLNSTKNRFTVKGPDREEARRQEVEKEDSLAIRNKKTFTNLKGIIKKGKNPVLHADQNYNFENSSNTQEKI